RTASVCSVPARSSPAPRFRFAQAPVTRPRSSSAPSRFTESSWSSERRVRLLQSSSTRQREFCSKGAIMNAIQQAAATRARSLRVGCLIFCLGLAAADAEPGAAELQKTTTKTETFDRDPGWEGFNNRIVPKKIPTITQDFGYSPTNFAGKHKGEMGGRITRAMKPAFYAVKIRKTLNDKLTASGTFAITGSTPGSGIFFGWFNAAQPGGGGRPVNSLGLDFDGEGSGGRLAVRLINSTNKSCGTFITPFIPGKFRPTPIKNDGTRYTWKLEYDPQGADGRGRFTFTIQG